MYTSRVYFSPAIQKHTCIYIYEKEEEEEHEGGEEEKEEKAEEETNEEEEEEKDTFSESMHELA